MAHHVTTPETRSVRLLKVGEAARHVIAGLLMRGVVHDDVLAAHNVAITEVRMSPDLRLATVFARPLLGADEAKVLAALRTHTAFFQREVAAKLKLKYAAKLRFMPDTSFTEAERIAALLANPKVARDLAAGEADGTGDAAGDAAEQGEG